MDPSMACSTSYASTQGPRRSLLLHQRRLRDACCIEKLMQRSNVVCGSQSRRFRHDFNPEEGGANAGGQAPFLVPQDNAVLVNNDRPESPPWGPGPPGSFQVPNLRGQHMRLSPASVPAPPEGGEEYYMFEVQSNLASGLPGIGLDPSGRPSFRAGFLQPFLDPSAPAFVSAMGVERFQYTLLDRVVHVLVALCYASGAALALTFLWERNYNLAAALTVNWARSKLSVGRLAILLSLAWVGKLWLYWVFFVGGYLDRLLERIAPPVRRVAWTLFILWLLYIALTPLHWHPLPLFGLSPFNMFEPLGAIKFT